MLNAGVTGVTVATCCCPLPNAVAVQSPARRRGRQSAEPESSAAPAGSGMQNLALVPEPIVLGCDRPPPVPLEPASPPMPWQPLAPRAKPRVSAFGAAVQTQPLLVEALLAAGVVSSVNDPILAEMTMGTAMQANSRAV